MKKLIWVRSVFFVFAQQFLYKDVIFVNVEDFLVTGTNDIKSGIIDIISLRSF